MEGLTNTVFSAPIANLLIIAGIVFMGIAVLGRIVGKIEPGQTGRIVSGIIGMLLLIIGLVMHVQQYNRTADSVTPVAQPADEPTTAAPGPAATATVPTQPTGPESHTSTTAVPSKQPILPASQTTFPDLYVSEFELSPKVPVQGQPVNVRIGIYNKGDKTAGPFNVQWYAGENFPAPEKEWEIESMAARGGRILTHRYKGYLSWYARLTTKVVIDPERKIQEKDQENNIYKSVISVSKR